MTGSLGALWLIALGLSVKDGFQLREIFSPLTRHAQCRGPCSLSRLEGGVVLGTWHSTVGDSARPAGMPLQQGGPPQREQAEQNGQQGGALQATGAEPGATPGARGLGGEGLVSWVRGWFPGFPPLEWLEPSSVAQCSWCPGRDGSEYSYPQTFRLCLLPRAVLLAQVKSGWPHDSL